MFWGSDRGKIGAICVGAAVAAALLSGCEATRRRLSQGEESATMGRVADGDVPLPPGFEEVACGSEDWRVGGRRVYLRQAYRGPASTEELRAFFRREMPGLRWAQGLDARYGDRWVMEFSREAELCRLELGIPDRGSGSVVLIRIGPGG